MFNSKYILRFDDVAPGMAWSKFLPLKNKIEDLGIKSILGVVPSCMDKSLYVENSRSDFFDLVRTWKGYGDSILQHGTYHLYTTQNAGILKINNSSEFSGMNYENQFELILTGKRILQEEKCWQPYFMAPSHSFDSITLKVLSDLDFVALSDGYGFFPYTQSNILFVPQLFSKPIKYLPGISTICIHINNMSKPQIDHLFSFIKLNKDSFIDFSNISSDYSSSKYHRLANLFCKSFLFPYRALTCD